MLGLDHNGPFLLAAVCITVVVLGGYGLYLRSRLGAARRHAVARDSGETAYSGRNVAAAAPMVTTAQTASSANGPSTP